MIERQWNEEECKKIARSTGVKQTLKDVALARLHYYHHGGEYVLLSRNEFFC